MAAHIRRYLDMTEINRSECVAGSRYAPADHTREESMAD